MEIKIKEIDFLETFAVRQTVLRSGKPLEECRFEGDELSGTIHFGYFEDEKLLGVISIFKINSPFFENQEQYQLRGMAVLESLQGKGIGKLLLESAENRIQLLQGDLIWFNARISAVEFYQKSGYEKLGEVFEIPDVGPHVVMFKKLK